MMVHFEESTRELRENALSLGFSLAGIEFLDLSPSSEALIDEAGYDVFGPSEVEGVDIIEDIATAIDEHEPDRIVLDPASQLRYLSPDAYQFRKRVLALKRHIHERDATLLMASSKGLEGIDEVLEYITDGTIELHMEAWGRSLEVSKFRGSDMAGGRHDMRIHKGGITVSPRLEPGEHERSVPKEPIPSGVLELDEQLHGGIERGTVTIISGPTGVGKTTTGTQFLEEASRRGEKAILYLFEENKDTFLTRCRAIGMSVDDLLDEGTLILEEIEPLALSGDEFAQRVRRAIEDGVSVVMLDAINGYRLSLRGDKPDVVPRLHALGRYLRNMGVTTIFIDETRDVFGSFQPTAAGLSYLADNLVFLRYIEIEGELRKVVGVLKKRISDFQRELRELSITKEGITVGEPFKGLHGVLGGVPHIRDRDWEG